ncbi:MAG: outer membrane protein [Thermodesulfobacteriota bacterium]
MRAILTFFTSFLAIFLIQSVHMPAANAEAGKLFHGPYVGGSVGLGVSHALRTVISDAAAHNTIREAGAAGNDGQKRIFGFLCERGVDVPSGNPDGLTTFTFDAGRTYERTVIVDGYDLNGDGAISDKGGCFEARDGDEEGYADSAVEFRGYGGYRYTLAERFVLGAEAHISIGDIKSNARRNGRYVGIRLERESAEYGASFISGFLLNQTDLLFLRVGYTRAEYAVNFSTLGPDATTPGLGNRQNPVANAGANFGLANCAVGTSVNNSLVTTGNALDCRYDAMSTVTQGVNGFQFGVGQETALLGGLSLRLDFIHNRYSSFKMRDYFTSSEFFCNFRGLGARIEGVACNTRSDATGTTITLIPDEIDITHDQFSIGLTYQFGGTREEAARNNVNKLKHGLSIGIGGGRAAGTWVYESPSKNESEELSIAGWDGQGFVGFDYVLYGDFVAGVNGGYQLGGFEYEKTVGFNTTIEQNSEIFVTGLLGYKLGNTSMFYVESGWTRADWDVTRLVDNGLSAGTVPDDQTYTGYVFGLGLKTAAVDNFFTQISWQYVDYGEEPNFYDPGTAPDRTSDASGNRFTISIGYTLPVIDLL